MKHAYLYMVHRYDKTLEHSLKLVDDPRNDIYIHVDAKCKNFPFDTVKAAVRQSGLFFTKREKVSWGGTPWCVLSTRC